MKMTLEEYIKNPMGKENAVFSQRYMFRDLYTDKFSKVMLREAGELQYRKFKSGETMYIIHMKIPSEVVPHFFYDVVMQFNSTDPAAILSNSLKDYTVKFFSNDPAFVFTFAYSFNKNNMFITDLESKMSKQALTDRAVIKNPKNIIGYVKSIYFAYLYFKNHGFDKKIYWTDAGAYDKNYFLSAIMPADQKIALREELGAKEKKAEKKPKVQAGMRSKYNHGGNMVSTSKHFGITKSAASAKMGRRVKYAKRK